MANPRGFDPAHPDFKFAYEHAKGAVEQQLEHGTHLDSKARIVFAIGSAIVGFVVPLLLTAFGSALDCVLLVFLVLIFVAYAGVVASFWNIYKGRVYKVADDPRTVGKYTVETSNKQELRRRTFQLMVNAYGRNEAVNKAKANWFGALFWAAIAQIILAVTASFLAAIPAFSLGW